MNRERDLFDPEAELPARPARVGRRVYLPASVRTRAEEMRRQGASLAAIAEASGVAVETVRTRLAVELERALPGGRRAGRPSWSPTAAGRADVERLAAEGLTVVAIAAALGVTEPTLRKHCRTELARGRAAR